MPRIYEYLGYILFFYSHEHKPIHVHIRYGEYESVAVLDMDDGKLVKVIIKRAKGKKPIPKSYHGDLTKFATKYHLGIIEKWTQFFVFKSIPKNEIIIRKIN